MAGEGLTEKGVWSQSLKDTRETYVFIMESNIAV
jgi:hypothetical protein